MKSGRRRGATWTQVHDWVTFSDVSPEAKALYAVMRAHIYRDSEDETVWTSTLALARVLGYSRGDKITKFVDELVGLKAVTRDRIGLHGVNVYEVEQEPPADYRGPRSSKEWHAMHGPQLDELRALEKASRDTRRARQRAERAGGAKPRSSEPVHPDRGEQAEVPVTPDRGEHVTPDRGEDVHPVSGREPSLGLTEGSLEDLRTTSSTEIDPEIPAEQEQEERTVDISSKFEDQETAEYVKSDAHWPTLTDTEQGLLVEARGVNPLWSVRTLRKVIGSRTIREIAQRDPELVRCAFLIGAKDRDNTVPMRMWYIEDCPHWKRAAVQLAAERSPEAAEPVRPPGQRPAPTHSTPSGMYDGPVGARPGDSGLPSPTAPPASVAALLAEQGIRVGTARESAEALR